MSLLQTERRLCFLLSTLSRMISFLHPQLVAHGVSQFRPAAIVFVQGFRSPLVYSISHGILPLAHPFPSPRAMATKQKCDDDRPVGHSPDALSALLSSVPSFRAVATNNNRPVLHSPDVLRAFLYSATMKYGSTEVALHHVMKTHDFTLSLLQEVLSGLSIPF